MVQPLCGKFFFVAFIKISLKNFSDLYAFFSYFQVFKLFHRSNFNEKQIITGNPIDDAMGSSGGGRFSEVIGNFFTLQRYCCERHPGYYIALWDTRTPSQRHLYC